MLLALPLLAPSGVPAMAQNNTGYPSGTDCADLIEPRRSACIDAFDPRPNPREIVPRPKYDGLKSDGLKSNALRPPAPRSLGHDVMPTDPKVPHTVPPPMLRGQHK
ncbi:hypothetical protein [Dongia sp.]|uniref:hypothetical protein n=1 Tax=Dongia sp. TaxID=1977262 RepID=UPI0035B039EE